MGWMTLCLRGKNTVRLGKGPGRWGSPAHPWLCACAPSCSRLLGKPGWELVSDTPESQLLPGGFGALHGLLGLNFHVIYEINVIPTSNLILS